MAKKVKTYIKLQVAAGKANPSPPVGPALGQHGVNIMEFCKAFNAHTQESGGRYADSGRDYRVYRSQLHLRYQDAARGGAAQEGCCGLKKGSGTPNTNKVGKVTRAQLEEIAKHQGTRPDGG